MIERIKEQVLKIWNPNCFDSLAVGVLDFSNQTFESHQFNSPKSFPQYFDIASLTKPLTLAATYLAHKDKFSEEDKLLLNHEGGLPAWGRLSPLTWKESLGQFPIHSAPSIYSDYSALRLMLNLENQGLCSLSDFYKSYWSEGVRFWKDLPEEHETPVTGFRKGRVIRNAPHDDNAFYLNRFCSHAGLFATIEGFGKTILKWNSKFQLLDFMTEEFEEKKKDARFLAGWDTVQDPEKTLAGPHAGPNTFGHLGFTGTSLWINPGLKRGLVIFSNATQKYWYAKENINSLRRNLGQMVWDA
jgi:hypothetical protein